MSTDIESLTPAVPTFADASTISYVYTYDLAGNRVQMLVDGSDMFDYGYDPVYQLTQSVLNSNTVAAYSYDNVNGRTQATELGATRVYTSNWLNQYTGITNPNKTLTYDDNGNMTYDGTYTYTYDIANRLIETSGMSSGYFYDYANRRTARWTTAEMVYYVYDGDHVIAEYLALPGGASELIRKYVYGPGIDRPVAMINVDGETETWYYYHQDAFESVVALSNSNGNLVERYRYTPFGKQSVYNAADTYIGTASAYGNPYMFTARRYDPETGLYYYRARMYSPTLGRFLQPDPIGYFDSMNLYQYCGNNSLNWVDPWGENWFGDWLDKFSDDLGFGNFKDWLRDNDEDNERTKEALDKSDDGGVSCDPRDIYNSEKLQRGQNLRQGIVRDRFRLAGVRTAELGLKSAIDKASGKAGDKIGKGVKDLTGSDKLGDKAKEKFGDYIDDKKNKAGR